MPLPELDYWFARIDFEKKPARAGELKLDRMRELLRRLGDPQDRLRIVHIAGTKGKGSTGAMFESVARAGGLTTGLYTSPHLVEVNERFRINGVPLDDSALVAAFTAMRPAVEDMERAGTPPTFFEIATAIAYHHFAAVGVQLAVMEVGLGGRFDATNVCTPALAIITSISYDHTAILGDKLSQIAFEKCGIVKPGVTTVSGAIAPEAAETVRTICAERGSELLELGIAFDYRHRPGRVHAKGRVDLSQMKYGDRHGHWTTCDIGLLGEHQAANASLVVTGANRLGIADAAVVAGLRSVRWPARMEVFRGPPTIVLDCAHNVASAKTVVDTLEESFPRGSRTLMFAASADKDVRGMLQVLAPRFDRFVLTQFRANPRALPTATILGHLRAIRGDAAVECVDDPIQSLQYARNHGELVVAAGSVFLAGDLRPALLGFNMNQS